MAQDILDGSRARCAHVADRAFARRGRFLAFPFDAVRAQYAAAVNAGLVERSLIASGRFEQTMARLERFMLGPFARRA